MYKNLRWFISFLIVFLVLTVTCVPAFATGTTKILSVTVNSITLKINGKVAKIDNFSFSGKIYIQPQDLSNQLNIDYIFDSKTKTISINDKKPTKVIVPAKANFSAVTSVISKRISVSVNSIKLKINGKLVGSDIYSYNGAVYASAKDMSDLLQRVYSLDVKTKMLSINNKKTTTITQIEDPKPSIPVLTEDVTQMTKDKVSITIASWGNAQKEEYSIDNGAWQLYTGPISITANCTVNARGTNKSGITSDIGVLKVTNILQALTVKDIAKKINSLVLINVYNANNTVVALGSGFIISPDGKVVTNYHVINMASSLEAVTSDNKKYKISNVLSYDVNKDIAVLQMDTTDAFSYVTLGDSDKISLGEDIVAIGSPLGLQNTVSDGIISSIRPDLFRKGFTDIQIDASIDHGSSGGALFNMYGEVIGITYAGMGSGNLNFAIPINDLKPMLQNITPKTLLQVKNEVYPNMSYDDFAQYIYDSYSANYSSGKYTLGFDDIYILDGDTIPDSEYPDGKKIPNSLFSVIYLWDDNFSQVYDAIQNGDKKDVEAWVSDIFSEFAAQYPNKNILIGFYLQTEYSTDPSALFPPDEIKKNDKNGKWDVTSLILIDENSGGSPNIVWDWEPNN